MQAEGNLQLTVEIMSGPDDGRQVQFRLADGDGNTGPHGTWVFTLGRRDDCDLCLPFDTKIVVAGTGRLWVSSGSSGRRPWLIKCYFELVEPGSV
jgi:hypothetical protein